jgi:hypothetical protein
MKKKNLARISQLFTHQTLAAYSLLLKKFYAFCQLKQHAQSIL